MIKALASLIYLFIWVAAATILWLCQADTPELTIPAIICSGGAALTLIGFLGGGRW